MTKIAKGKSRAQAKAEAEDYARRAFEAMCCCKHGHFSCATVEGGACSDELLSRYEHWC